MTWMDLEGIMLSEISQIEKKNTVSFHLFVDCEITKQNRNCLMYTEDKLIVARGEKGGVMGEKVKRKEVQMFSYEINKP
mgnify:CR=1 FL=1